MSFVRAGVGLLHVTHNASRLQVNCCYWSTHWQYCYIPYLLGPSPLFSGFPVMFPPVPDHFCTFYAYFVPFFSVVFLIMPLSVPFHVFRLFPSIPLFRLVSFQFSILGSDCSESGSLPLIHLHLCLATILFPIDLHILLSFDHMTPFPLRIMICPLIVLLSGKLCSYSLACNWTKPSVTWPSINLNTQSLSVSVLAS